MGFDRRRLLTASVALGFGLMSGCARAGSHEVRTLRGWNEFKAAFLAPEGRIVDTGNGGISHSEGQGYAMVLAEAAGDRDAFDRLHGWTEKTLARPHDALFSWRFDPAQAVPVSDPNNATDGDLLIAWALLRAGDRWNNKGYRDRSQAIRDAIRSELVVRQGPRALLLPGVVGFDQPARKTINLSYYIWSALDAFRDADGSKAWGDVIKDGERLVKEARFGPLALPVDWTDIAPDGTPSPAIDKPPRFGFDAIRLPLYLAMGGRKADADTIARFWKGYIDLGRPIPAWVDVQTGEIAPYAVSPGGCDIVRKLLGNQALTCPPLAGPDYYSSVLQLLVQL